MKKLITTMTFSVIIGQPILAGPLSTDTMVVNGDPKLLGASNLNGTVMAQRRQGDSSLAYSLARGLVPFTFGLLFWLQFDRASNYEAEAALNREHGQLLYAQKLEDKADRARLYGWSAAALAAGSLGGALIWSKKSTRRVFPKLSFRDGEPHVGVSYAYSF